MKTTQFRNLINLFENRLPDIEYQETEKEVIALLRSHDSQVYTKLAQKVEKISALEEEIKALKEEVKQSAREDVAALFNAEDAVKTRVVKTVSLIVQISKDPEPTKSPKYKDILAVLETKMTPELIAVLEQLKKTMVTVTQKEAGLKIKRELDEGQFSSLFQKLNQLVQNWGQGYDQKLEQLAQAI
jgi:uncharacterized protein (UPF0335 family)